MNEETMGAPARRGPAAAVTIAHPSSGNRGLAIAVSKFTEHGLNAAMMRDYKGGALSPSVLDGTRWLSAGAVVVMVEYGTLFTAGNPMHATAGALRFAGVSGKGGVGVPEDQRNALSKAIAPLGSVLVHSPDGAWLLFLLTDPILELEEFRALTDQLGELVTMKLRESNLAAPTAGRAGFCVRQSEEPVQFRCFAIGDRQYGPSKDPLLAGYHKDDSRGYPIDPGAPPGWVLYRVGRPGEAPFTLDEIRALAAKAPVTTRPAAEASTSTTAVGPKGKGRNRSEPARASTEPERPKFEPVGSASACTAHRVKNSRGEQFQPCRLATGHPGKHVSMAADNANGQPVILLWETPVRTA